MESPATAKVAPAADSATERTRLTPSGDAPQLRRATGIGIALGVVLCGSMEPSLSHFLLALGGEMLSILVWKHAGITSVGLALSCIITRSAGRGPASRAYSPIREALWPIGLASGCLAIANLTWSYALLVTSSLHAVVLVAINPGWAMLLSWVLLHHRPHTHTLVVCAVLAICAVLLIAASCSGLLPWMEARGGAGAEAGGREATTILEPSPGGDLMALLSGLMTAAYTTTLVWASTAYPDAPLHVAPPIANGGCVLVLLFACAFLADRPLAALLSWPLGRELPFAAGLAAAASLEALWDLGPAFAAKYISSVEIGLVLLLEVAVGPFFVYLAYAERPSDAEMLVATAAVVALVVNEAGECWQARDTEES